MMDEPYGDPTAPGYPAVPVPRLPTPPALAPPTPPASALPTPPALAPSGPPERRRGLIVAAAVAAVVLLAAAGAGAYALLGSGATSTAGSGVARPSVDAASSAGGPGALPSSAPATSFPGLGVSLCAGATSGLSAATTYVGAALSGIGEFAESCVYQHSVPRSITASLQGKLYAPMTNDTEATDIRFSSVDGTSRITVHTKKEPDAHWYVVAVTTG